MEPFLRWAGSKRQLIPRLRRFWSDDFRRYIEPFAGSASLFFAIEPDRAILGDANGELISTMRAVKENVDDVLACLRRLPSGERAYYRVRGLEVGKLSRLEIAGRFIYLNHYCFNGIFRTNKKGRFNVPYGPPKSGARVRKTPLVRASSLLKRARLLSGDFAETLSHAGSGDFVYLDPPYAVSTRRLFAEYLPNSFGQSDLGRLGKELRTLDNRGAAFVITYADSPEGRRLLSPWNCTRVWTRRNIAGFAGNRRGSYEILATNLALGGGNL
jgi:DNA adenine methylase